MVWALDRLAQAGVHAPQRDWAGAATDIASRAAPLPPSLLVGRAGILLVAWLLQPSAETADLLALEIAANVGNETNELLWGSPGTMLAAAAMIERGGEERFAELWRRSAAQLLDVRDPDGCWTQQMYGATTRYFGAGHGFAGNAHALLGRPDLLDDAAGLAAGFARIVLDQAIGTHETANWPPYAGGPLEIPGQTIRVQWCHGAPGIVTAFAAAQPKDAELTRILVAGGELVWRAGPLSKGHGLCHGTAGTASPSWRCFTARATSSGWSGPAPSRCTPRRRSRTSAADGRYALWTGDIGAALLLERCIDGAGRGFPTLDWW